MARGVTRTILYESSGLHAATFRHAHFCSRPKGRDLRSLKIYDKMAIRSPSNPSRAYRTQGDHTLRLTRLLGGARRAVIVNASGFNRLVNIAGRRNVVPGAVEQLIVFVAHEQILKGFGRGHEIHVPKVSRSDMKLEREGKWKKTKQQNG